MEGDSRLCQGHIRGPATTDRGHPHVGVIEKITMLRKPGHTAGYVGQSGTNACRLCTLARRADSIW